MLMLVASVIEKTDVVNKISNILFTTDKPKFSMLKLTFSTAFISAFINNTAVVASFLGFVKNNNKFPPSKYLIPMVYAVSLGGMITLIGTSTSLVINGLMIDKGIKSFELFDFSYIGIPVTICGIIYLVFLGYKLMPANVVIEEIKSLDYFLEAKVIKNSSLIGKTIEANGIRNLKNIFLAELIRNEKLISPVSPDEVVQEGDVFVFTGDISKIHELQKFNGLKILEEKDKQLIGNLQEAIISHQSNLIGKTLKESRFRTKFDASVVAVKRLNEKLSGKLGSITLKAGDTLILAAGSDFHKRDNIRNNFYLANKLPLNNPLFGLKGIIATGCFFAAILLSATGVMPLVKSLLIVLFIFLVTNYTSIGELKNTIPFGLILLIGSSLGIAQVMIDCGAAKLIAEGIIGIFGKWGVMGNLIGIYLFAFIITQFVTNNAAGALSFPIAYSAAHELGVNPLPFMMAIAFAASASYLTPFGYQTNLMVYSIGQYKFLDYIKIGLPLAIIYSIIVILLIPLFFKF